MNTPQTMTPGPWESEHHPGGYRRKPTIVIRSKGSTPKWRRVARVDNEADAVAFLAVPAMLEALSRFECEPCRCDVLNPCFNNRPTDVVGKHWGGGEACAPCNARGVLKAVRS